jgi:Glycosyltransferase family 87
MSLSISRIVPKPWGSFAVASALLIWVVSMQLRAVAHPRFDGVHPVQPYGVIGTFWASGDAARKGLDPYGVYPYTFRPHAFFKDGPVVYDPNLNPPALLPLFSFIARFPLPRVAKAWKIISALIVLVTAAGLIRRYHIERKQLWWLLTGGAVISTFSLQQSYWLLFVTAALAWCFLDSDNDIEAGICLGLLCAIKPNFAPWPLALALAGRRKFIPAALIVFVVLSLIPIVAYGPPVYAEWLRAASVDSHSIFPSDVSLAGNATRWGARPVGYVLSALLLLLTAILARFGRPTLREVSGFAICAAILCSPLAWMHYVLVLTPVLVSRFWRRPQQVAAILLWIIPVFLEPTAAGASHWSLAIRGSGYLLAFLILYGGFAREPLRQVRERLIAEPISSHNRGGALIEHGNIR